MPDAGLCSTASAKKDERGNRLSLSVLGAVVVSPIPLNEF